MYTREEIKKIISTYNSEYNNEYARDRIKEISLSMFFSTSELGTTHTYIYEVGLRILRREWIKELQTIGNPYVLYIINKRIVALRTILKEGF